LLVVYENQSNFWKIATVSDIVLNNLAYPHPSISGIKRNHMWFFDFNPKGFSNLSQLIGKFICKFASIILFSLRVDNNPIINNTFFIDLFSNIEDSLFYVNFLLLSNTNSWYLKINSFNSWICFRDFNSPLIAVFLCSGNNLMSELRNIFIPPFWIKASIFGNLTHQSVIILRLFIQSSHLTQLRNQIEHLFS
jgi:hypothetical protein